MNPGSKEGFFGECDDVLAAAKYLAAQSYVDPTRIFLGGHSTGGTLTLLVAELTNPFRAIFAFGPVANPVSYGEPSFTPFDTRDAGEVELRAPGAWLDSVAAPTWVIEGTDDPSNLEELRRMASQSENPMLHFIEIRDRDHFSVLDPTNRVLAQDIVADSGSGTFEASLR